MISTQGYRVLSRSEPRGTLRRELDDVELTERKKIILRAIVENYIATAEPVGSKAVAELTGLKVSSATIRNDMADLEEMGYLEQPHTSAGRIPSAAGYRVYVNELMEQQKLSTQETDRINQALNSRMAELDKVIDEAGKLISQMTHYPAFAMATASHRITIKRYDLIMVDANSFIAVVMTDGDVVRNKIIRLPSDLNQPQLQLLNTLLNSSFVGLTLTEITPELMRVAQHAVGESYGLISLVVSFAMDVLQELENQSVHTAGLSNLLAHPEYQTIDKAQPLLEYLSEEMDPSQLPVPQTEQMKIIIGPENAVNELKDTSVVLASYDIGDNMRGVIGVVGPTRMDYAKVTARLAYFTDSLTRMFGKNDPSLPPPGGATDSRKEE